MRTWSLLSTTVEDKDGTTMAKQFATRRVPSIIAQLRWVLMLLQADIEYPYGKGTKKYHPKTHYKYAKTVHRSAFNVSSSI